MDHRIEVLPDQIRNCCEDRTRSGIDRANAEVRIHQKDAKRRFVKEGLPQRFGSFVRVFVSMSFGKGRSRLGWLYLRESSLVQHPEKSESEKY